MTLECGKVGQQHGVDHATDYLAACLHLAEIPSHPVAPHDIDLYHTVAVAKVPAELSIGFCGAGADVENAVGRRSRQAVATSASRSLPSSAPRRAT